MELIRALLPSLIGAALMGTLLYNNRKMHRWNHVNAVLLDAVLALTLAICCTELAAIGLDGWLRPGVYVISFAVQTLRFALCAAALTTWCAFTVVSEHRDTARVLPQLYGLAALFGISLLLTGLNIFTGWLFAVTPVNRVQRGTLGGWCYVLALVLLAYSVWVVSRDKSYHRTLRQFPVLSLLVPLVIGGGLELMLGLYTVGAGLAVGLTACCIRMQSDSAYLDPLTGLYNRLFFGYYLRQLRREPTRVCACIKVDIDRFKRINDQYGHEAGDNAIRDTAYLLTTTMPEDALLLRYGGDEFVAMLNTEHEAAILHLLDRLQDAIEQFNETIDRPYTLSVSTGYTLLHSDGGTDDFLRRIDEQVLAEKNRKREGVPADWTGGAI